MAAGSVPARWPQNWKGADAVFFDCDSTLSAIEGIDELGARAGVEVAELTRRSMAGEVGLDEVYRRRLELVNPGADDLAWLAGRYSEEAVVGAREVVRALGELGIACHLISGGLLPAVAPFARGLGFRAERIHAVPYAPGAIDVAVDHPLARRKGKAAVIQFCCGDAVPASRRLLVGDGASDLEAAPAVGLFVGFGGVVDREAVREASPVYLTARELAPVAVLAAGPERWNDLEQTAPALFARGSTLLADPATTLIPCPST